MWSQPIPRGGWRRVEVDAQIPGDANLLGIVEAEHLGALVAASPDWGRGCPERGEGWPERGSRRPERGRRSAREG